jgi:beta-lactamase regulating signal transducer with metallopeptidase domain
VTGVVGAMDPIFLLSVAAAIAVFLLKTTLAFGACVALSRLVVSADFRFVTWSGYLYGSAAYWFYLAYALCAGRQQSTVAPGVVLPPASSVGAWQIPVVWAFPLGVTLRVIGIIYMLTLCYLFFLHLQKRRHLRWVLSFTTEPPAGIAERFAVLAKKLHARRSRLLILSGVTSPATFGWIRPTILLPASCLEDDPSELEDILNHELHHVRRCDAIWNGFALASRALLFFHPAVWYAVRKMQVERELACDHAVISASPARRGKYAECLVRFARLNMMQEPGSWGIDFAASHLTLRVHSILADPKKSPAWMLYLRIASGLTIFALFLGIAPSLAVLLTYAHQQEAKNVVTSVFNAPRPALRSGTRANKTPHSLTHLSNSSVTSLRPIEAYQPSTDSQTDAKSQNPGAQSRSGPQLLHRGDASATGNKSVKQQTVALVDTDAKGQPAKAGDDKESAVRQTATTALGIYRQISSVDRH